MYCYTHEFVIAFLQATDYLCPDVQRLIWSQVLTELPPIPQTPIKKCLKQ
jgi:hypothetical protein